MIDITTNEQSDNFVEGFQVFEQTCWKYIHGLISEGPLQFLVSTANLQEFTANFQYFNSEVRPIFSQMVPNLPNIFDVDTFVSVYQIDLIENL